MHCREEIGHTQEEAERDKVGSIRLELGARQLARVLGSASTALVKSEKAESPGLADSRESAENSLCLASVSPSLPPLHSHLCPQLRSDKKGRKCEDKSQDPGDVSPGAAFTGHLVQLVPQGPNAHLAHIPGCTVTPCGWGWRHSSGPDRLPCHHPPDLSWYREPQES